MKNAKWMFAVALALTVLPGLAVAQLKSGERITAKVPFQFVVSNKIVPAGTYQVTSAAMTGRTLSIENAGAKVGLFLPASRTESKTNAASYALVFKKYGNQHFLSQIKLAGSRIMYRLPESKAEAELRAQNVAASEEILLASLK